MRSRKFTLPIVFLATAAVLAGCSADAEAAAPEPAAKADPDTLVFAAIPTEESVGLQQKYSLVQEVIEKETGHNVEFRDVTDYAAVIEAQRSGQVQLGGYGPFSYVTAKDTGVDLVPLGVPVEDPGNAMSSFSYAVAKPGSGIDSIADMAGKTVCFVDPGSTSGYLYPIAELMSQGIDPENGISPMFAGGHDASALAVLDGSCDAGFVMSEMIETILPNKGLLNPGELNVFWTSDAMPASPLAMSASLSEELQAKLTDVFHNKLNRPWLAKNGYCDTEEACQLPNEVAYGYVAIADSDYDGIRKVCETTKADACAS
jgi:phosphonate transport system substrate-binding protein